MGPFLILVIAFSFYNPVWARVRRVEVTQDQIVTVRTALGIATIVQVPDRPNSIVVGDQAGFKVEYLDQAITVKPLRQGAKSNLYIYTDWRRFNVQLETGAEGAADYVVYLEEPTPRSRQPSLRWTSVARSLQSEGLTLTVRRLAKTKDGRLLIEFTVSANGPEKFDPGWIWLTQKGKPRPIQSLFLSMVDLAPSISATGTLEILLADVQQNEPLRLELRKKKTAALVLPKATGWK